ncbi:hypothetical protein ElyMa_001349600 [Elysia marginata]|uniref:Uncharacterized protein n=1 Tax=Elysia marginata TaxID=1093978 RepID=A0AAV4IMB7_9GAST|nr:hypothetical protein ElyMa_001349600 [Elysia marginata]
MITGATDASIADTKENNPHILIASDHTHTMSDRRYLQQSSSFSKASQKVWNDRREKLRTKYPISPVATVAYIRSQLGNQGSWDKFAPETYKDQQCRENSAAMTSGSRADDGFISLQTKSFHTSQNGTSKTNKTWQIGPHEYHSDVSHNSYIAAVTGSEVSGKKFNKNSECTTGMKVIQRGSLFLSKSTTPHEEAMAYSAGMTKEDQGQAVRYRQTDHSRLQTTNKQNVVGSNENRDCSKLSMANQSQIYGFHKPANLFTHETYGSLNTDNFKSTMSNVRVQEREILTYPRNEPAANPVLEKNNISQNTVPEGKKHFCVDPPRIQHVTVKESPYDICIKKQTSGVHQRQQIGHGVQHIANLRCEQTGGSYARSSENPRFQLEGHNTFRINSVNSHDMPDVNAKFRTSIASSGPDRPSVTSSISFTTSTPVEKLKYFQHTPISAAKAHLQLSPPTELFTETRSEPRHVAFDNVRDITCPDRLERMKDGEVISNRDCPPKSAPDYRRVKGVGQKVCHRLKPVNLFPEWTRERQRALRDSEGQGKEDERLMTQGSNGLRFEDMIHQDEIKSTTDSSSVCYRNQHKPLPKRNPDGCFFTTNNNHLEGTDSQRTFPNSRKYKGQYWFHDNTIRRLSALDPSIFKERGISQGRSSMVGVKQAKSVDIAAIYSQPQNLPKTKIFLSHDGANIFENQRRDRTKYKRLSEVHSNSSNEMFQASTCTNGQTLNYGTLSKPSMINFTHSRTQPPIARNRKSATISIEDHGIPEEEFRPADLVLKDLHYSPARGHTYFEPMCAPQGKQNNTTRMSLPERNNVRNNHVNFQEINCQSFNATDRNKISTNGEEQNKMTQANIRDCIERNRQRFRMSLPAQSAFSERVHYFARNDVQRKMNQNQLYDITEEKPESPKPMVSRITPHKERTSYEMDCEKKPVKGSKDIQHTTEGDRPNRHSISQNNIQSNSNLKIRPTKHPPFDEFFKQLDAAVSRRHTIHFGSHQAETVHRVSTHASIDTISSGYRSLERDERLMGQHQVVNIPEKSPYPPDQKLNTNLKSVKSSLGDKYQEVQSITKEAPPSTVFPAQGLGPLKEVIQNPLCEQNVSVNSELHNLHRLMAEQPKGLPTTALSNPILFTGSKYRRVQGPKQFWGKKEPKDILTDRINDPVSHFVSQTEVKNTRKNRITDPVSHNVSQTEPKDSHENRITDPVSHNASQTEPKDTLKNRITDSVAYFVSPVLRRDLANPASSQTLRRQTIAGIPTQQELKEILSSLAGNSVTILTLPDQSFALGFSLTRD